MLIFCEFLDEMAPEKNRIIPFMQRLEIDNNQIQLYADTSGHPSQGLRCYFHNEWAQGLSCDTNLITTLTLPNRAVSDHNSL